MRGHLSNSAYGLLDYMVQPVMMLLAAPFLLRHLGVAEYGVWLIASAAVGAGSIVSSGFGDAVIQCVATLRASGDLSAIRKVIANLLAINLLLSGALAMILWGLIPWATQHITHFDPSLQRSCLWSLHIGAVLIVLKSIESVFISAQRAFERYGPAVRIGIVTRGLTILVSIGLALRGFGVPALMVATGVVVMTGLIAQWAALRRHLGDGLFKPSFDKATFRDLTSFGGFTWLQAVSGIVFNQADRLLLGATLGASAVSYYGLCVQVAQPIHGLTAAGLHFLFPHLAMRVASGSISAIRRPVYSALAINVISASGVCVCLMLFGPRLVAAWMGPLFAAYVANLLPVLAFGFGLLALNVTAHYTLLALGRVRLVTALNVAGGVVMLMAMATLVHSRGVEGAAWARLCYGPITCLLYLPLLRLLWKVPTTSSAGTPQIARSEA
jgi:O-antigen/teichoic acid export membrane protein